MIRPRTLCTPAAPVVTFLAASPSAAAATQGLLSSLTGLCPVHLGAGDGEGVAPGRDGLDRSVFSSALPLLRRWRLESAASVCRKSGAVLHFLSPTNAASGVRTPRPAAANHISLLAITAAGRGKPFHAPSRTNPALAVQHARIQLSRHVDTAGSRWAGLRLAISGSRFGIASSSPESGLAEAARLLLGGSGQGLPLLDLPSVNDEHYCEDEDDDGGSFSEDLAEVGEGLPLDDESHYRLREIVLPHFPDSVYPNGETLASAFGHYDALERPKIGLYQWPVGGIVFRPLPGAGEDMALPPPSLVFQCNDLDEAAGRVAGTAQEGTKLARVGFTGSSGGQFMVRNPCLKGLDLRLCDSPELSSAFAEGQESLMAGSLESLQSSHVMAEPPPRADGEWGHQGLAKDNLSDESEGRLDARNGLGDCWIEFRANAKAPAGFFRKRDTTNKIAKPPDMPYQ